MSEKARSNRTGKEAGDKQNFYANEVCYGLAVAIDLGMSDKDMLEFIRDDLIAWSKKALPKGKKENRG